MKISIQDFYQLLDDHDWYYQFSDDDRVYRRGAASMIGLMNIAANNGPEYKALLEAFNMHYFSGKPWKTPKAPKPDMPREDNP